MAITLPRGLLLALLILVGPRPSAAQDRHDRLFQATVLADVALSGADLSTTLSCLRRDVCHEGNPLLRPLAQSPMAFGIVKMSVTTLTSVALMRLHTSHPRITWWVAAGQAIGLSVVVVRNSRVGTT